VVTDKQIREPLFEYLESNFGKVRILEEKTVGKSRADVLMITEDALYGIEIKSDADSYVRLSSQVKDYDKYFDYNIVAVGASHGQHVEEHVPDHWGIITVETVDDQTDVYLLRRPQINPKVKLKYQLELFWRPELATLQELNDMPKYKNYGKDFVIKKIMERIPDKIDASELKRQMSDILFERDYTNVRQMLKEYRKGEMQKAIEAENDPEKKLQLMMAREEMAKRVPTPPRRYRRRRRLRSS